MFNPTTHILVVDDMMTMRKLIRKSLTALGFSQFTEAADGALAWEALSSSQNPVQLVISDWNMPNCTGLDFLKRVRADSRFKALPFVLLTAEAEAHQVKEALLAGVSNYIIKPFTTDMLKEKLQQTYSRVAAPKT